MSYHCLDPGDPNNWYQSPYLGLSPAGYGGGISGGYYRAPYHPYGSSTYAFTQFSSQPSPYPPLQLNPSATIISGHLFPHQFPSVAQQPLTTTPRDPYIPTYHSPHSNSNPGIYPSISQSHSYDPSGTGVHSQFIFTKAMTTPPIYPSAPTPPACEQPQYHMNTSIPTFQSPLAPTFVPQTHNNEDTTNPSSPPPISNVSVQKEVLRPEAALSSLIDKLEMLCQLPSIIGTEEVGLASLGWNPDEECRRDDAVVPKGTANGVNLASTPELYPEFVSLNTVPSNLNLLSHDSTDIAIDAVSARRNNNLPSFCWVSNTSTRVCNQFNFLNDDCSGMGFVFGANGIDEKLENEESVEKRAEVNSRDGREFSEPESVSAKQDEGEDKEQLSNGMSEFHALQLFDKMPKSEELCNTRKNPCCNGLHPIRYEMVTDASEASETIVAIDSMIKSCLNINLPNKFASETVVKGSKLEGSNAKNSEYVRDDEVDPLEKEHSDGFDDKENDVKQPDFSEVGHNALGAGQIVDSACRLQAVDSALESGKIYQEQDSKYIKEVFETGTLHLIGLLSDGGVHSRLDQVQLLLKGVVEHGAKRIRLHVLTDGRDVLDGSSVKFAGTLDEDLAQLREKGVDAQIASGGGRMYVTMDCYENDWSVVKRGWDAQVLGEAPSKFKNAVEAITTLRAEPNANDQYLPPFVIVDDSGKPVGPIVDGDAVVTFNFRADRMVMAAKAFEYADFDKFDRVRVLKIRYVGSIKPLINQSSDSLVKETKSPRTLALTLVIVENKKGVSDVTKALVALMNESKQEVPNWLNDYAEQSLSYGGDQSQVYGSSSFGGYNFCGNDNYSYCETSYNGGESNAPGTAGSLSFGNYCFSVSGAVYFPNFMITFIEFGFVAIDVGALALVPQIHFSVHMWSKEALLLILLSTIMRSETMVGKVMNMNLETMVGKVGCGREKELHVNLFKIHREPLEKCVGYVLSTLNASCLRVQKLFLVDWAFANVPISWKDVETKLFALNMVTKVLLQEGNPTGRSDQFKFKAFVLMITSEGKLPCKCLFGLPFSRMVFLICRLIDWKRCQGYHVVLRIAALKIYL